MPSTPSTAGAASWRPASRRRSSGCRATAAPPWPVERTKTTTPAPTGVIRADEEGVRTMRQTRWVLPLLVGFIAVTASSSALAEYSVCRSTIDNKEYLQCSGPCPGGDPLVSRSPNQHPLCPGPQAANKEPDCGRFWTGWKNIGDATGSPCPPGCKRLDEHLGVDLRSVGVLPPRPQAKYKFQCVGTPTAEPPAAQPDAQEKRGPKPLTEREKYPCGRKGNLC
jgi:hypothetical protein